MDGALCNEASSTTLLYLNTCLSRDSIGFIDCGGGETLCGLICVLAAMANDPIPPPPDFTSVAYVFGSFDTTVGGSCAVGPGGGTTEVCCGNCGSLRMSAFPSRMIAESVSATDKGVMIASDFIIDSSS